MLLITYFWRQVDTFSEAADTGKTRCGARGEIPLASFCWVM